MMNYKFIKSISFFILCCLTSCATYKTQYADDLKNKNQINNVVHDDVEHTFFLIGDAGNANKNDFIKQFTHLKNEIASSSKNATVLFLGDNIYEQGMPEKGHPKRKIAEEILDNQIKLVENFKGQTIFIPGNHDYYNDGIIGLERQENYIKKALDNKNAFLPKNGCPIKRVKITDDIVLILIDTQWFLEDWDDNPQMNDKCDIKTREHFFDEFESLIKKNATKTTLIAMHHPMFTNGSHNGHYSLKQQLFPIGDKIPLPIIGSVINLVRKTGGISPQDLQNALYLKLKKRIVTISQKSPKAIFVSGHEHNLQYIVKDNKPQIISGSGTKTSAIKLTKGGEFGSSQHGYAKLEVYKNGSSNVSFYSVDENKVLFNTEIFPLDKSEKEYNYTDKFPKTIAASIYSEKETTKSKFYKSLWGEHYRKYYSKKITAPTVLLDTLFGGLTILRKGGGNQSKSIRLEDKNGKQYVMRALRKSATQYLQAVAFKDQYIEGQFDDTYTEDLLLDIYTATHPYASLAIGDLADAIDIYHPNPKLYYIPKQNALKHFNDEFGDKLYMIEERVTSGHGDVASFGYANEIISTIDLLKELRTSDDVSVDEDTYIRARLFDMLIGDWDRHQDQWRWAKFTKTGKSGKTKTTYKPIPRDRDQAFYKNDGPILQIITTIIPALRMMQEYDDKIKNVKWFNASPYSLDMALINQATYKNWITQVEYIQENMTDEVINKAFNQLPNELNDETIVEIKSKLKARLKILSKIAEKYYKTISKYAVVKGTDKDNLFKIKRLKNGITSIKIYNIKKNKEKGSKFFEKKYDKNETKEIWVYGLDDDDVFEVTGVRNNVIPLKIIGGQNNDEYKIKNKKRVVVYDFKTKESTIKSKNGKYRLRDSYKQNIYNHKKLKYNQNLASPAIGSDSENGINIGFSNVYTVYGFARNPFTQQHALSFNFFLKDKGYKVTYDAEFANIFNHWNFVLETNFTSPDYVINYFGFGNKTINNTDTLDDDFYKTKLSTYTAFPSLKWVGRTGAEFKIGGTFEDIEVKATDGRIIDNSSTLIGKGILYAGIKTTYSYKSFDNKAFPTLGMTVNLNTGWKTNLENKEEHHFFINPAISFDYKLNSSGNVILASKLKGDIIIGDNLAFYNAASIGGNDGLRGYQNRRFIGHKSFYQNTDLRFHLKDVRTALVPFRIGLLGGFDYGRVWLDNEKSNHWKTSYGAGFWLVGADMININLSAFKSDEGTYLKFGMGFKF